MGRRSLKRSMSEAQTIQKQFEDMYASEPGVNGIGLGLNQSEDDFSLKVFASDPTVKKTLPNTYSDLEVQVDVSGPIKSY